MMFVGFCLGVVFCLFVQGMIKLGQRSWQTHLAPPPQPPRTRAQLVNEQVFDEQERSTTRMHSLRLQRRRSRGRRPMKQEDGYGHFE